MRLSDDVFVIGDPHIGREFKTGVPLHRRGEREASQLSQLRDELNESCRLNIMVGDMFDKPFVPLKVVHAVADLYEEAALAQPDRWFVLLAGNHDLPREVIDPKTGKVIKASFHALARMLSHLPNVIVLFEPAIIQDVALFPWEWTVTAKEQVEKFDVLTDLAVGHWDLVDFGGSLDHLCPVSSLLARGTKRIVSGHIHIAGSYPLEGFSVECIGSMQPYAHGQGGSYLTLTLHEIESIDPDQLKDKNLRVILAPGEILPDLDCLSIVPMREDEAEDLQMEEVGLGSFDLKVAIEQGLEEQEVPERVRQFIREKLGAIA